MAASSESGDTDNDFRFDTQSLTTSVTDYPMEHGRRYHKYHENSYLYPNDERELDRLDMQFEMLKRLHRGKIFFSPLRNPQQILDVGTGTGIWCIQMASKFPKATITGTDLSPVQPTEVPEKVHFLIDDAAEPDWLWPRDHFDLIHTSMMLGSLPSFSRLIRTAYKYIKPGGYLECHEYDITCRCDDSTLPPEDPNCNSPYALHNWVRYAEKSNDSLDPPRPLRYAHKLSRWMREAGYVDVQEKMSKIPLNPWPSDPQLRQIGEWNQRNWLDGLGGFTYRPFGRQGLGWTQQEIEVFLVDVRKCIQDVRVHTYHHFHVVTGRKPETG